MKPLRLIATAVLITLSFGCSQDPADSTGSAGADLILVNGRVYTLDWDEPAADGTIILWLPCPGANRR